MITFLHGILQVYLEVWNLTGPFEEYVPDFTKQSRCVQDEHVHMINGTVSLLKHIRSWKYLPNINTVKRMDEFQKPNMVLIAILDEYLNTNIWMSAELDNLMYFTVLHYIC